MSDYEPKTKAKRQSNAKRKQKKPATHLTHPHALPALTMPSNSETVIAVTVQERPLKEKGGVNRCVTAKFVLGQT